MKIQQLSICIKMTFTGKEKIFCVTLYLESSKLHKTVQAKFTWKFSFNAFAAKSAIHQWVSTFKATETVLSINKKAAAPTSGRKMTARTPGNIEAVRIQSVEVQKNPSEEGCRSSGPFMPLCKGYLM